MWELAAACGTGRRAWLPGCLRTALSLGPAAPPANTQDGSRGVMTNVRTHPAGIHGCTGWARLARGSPVAIPTPPHPGQQSRWGQSLRPRSAGRRDQERVVRKVRSQGQKAYSSFQKATLRHRQDQSSHARLAWAHAASGSSQGGRVVTWPGPRAGAGPCRRLAGRTRRAAHAAAESAAGRTCG